MSTGLFLSFEGLDGSGKSTQLQHLTRRLDRESIPYLLNREPGGTRTGNVIRSLLLDPRQSISPTAELLLYFANRAQNVDEQIRPALAAGRLVISDRYTDSTLAYQGHARSLGAPLVEQLHHIACRGTEPTLTFYLRIRPETSRARLRRQSPDRLEAETDAFHLRVFEAYEQLAARYPERIQVIDGERGEATIAADIWRIFESRWSAHAQ